MREILFRGKVIESNDYANREWIFGHLVVRPDHDGGPNQHFICESGYRFIRCLNKMIRTYKVDPETIGQHTGLKDRNGVGIFEGDVLRSTNGMYSTCKIIFNDYCKSFQVMVADGYSEFFFETIDPRRMEVIGNIHDNPELLEVEG